VAFLHRFGSTLNAHIHLHICLIDGVIAQPSQELRFHPAQLDDADIQRARQAIRKRVLRLFKLGLCAEKKWRRLRGFDYLAKVVTGIKFKDGVEVTGADQVAA